MKTIIALVDFSDSMPEVVRMAGRMARAFDGTAYLVHAVDPESGYDGETLREDASREALAHEMRRKRRTLKLAALALNKLGTKAVAMLVLGSPVKTALLELDRRKPDLVVVGTHGRGWLHHLLPGSVGATVASKAHCPVLIVPGARPSRAQGPVPSP